jgi:hypothetical protein
LADFPAPGGPGDPAGPGGRDQDWKQGGLRGLPRRRPGGAQGVRRLQDVGADLSAPGLSAPREGRVGEIVYYSHTTNVNVVWRLMFTRLPSYWRDQGDNFS